MTITKYIMLFVTVFAAGLRVPVIMHYLKNWKARSVRNPESVAIVYEVALHMFMALNGCALLADPGMTGNFWYLFVVVSSLSLFVAVHFHVAFWAQKKLGERRSDLLQQLLSGNITLEDARNLVLFPNGRE